MGLFGRSAEILPFFQSPKTQNGGPFSLLTTRRNFRCIERGLIALFCAFFVGVFLTSLYYLPDISTKVHSVGREFLILDRESLQGRRPRRPFPSPSYSGVTTTTTTTTTTDSANRDIIRKKLDGRLHAPNADQEETDAVENPNELPAVAPWKSPYGAAKDPENEKRRQKIINMMKHAWSNYVKYAWGANELRPISKRGHNPSIFGKAKFGATIVDATDTLYLMGLLEEYQVARKWIAENLNVTSSEGEVSVFEFNIRYIGGLLSAFALTGDKMFLGKADEMANAILPAFDTPTGIPYAIIDLKQKKSKNYGWASGGASILAEFGSLHLEWAYLSKMIGKPVYLDKVKRIRQHLATIEKPKGLYPNYLNPQTGKWGQVHVSLGALGDSFYEYLFKTWLWSNKTDTQAKEMYDAAMEALEKHMYQTSKGGLKYYGDYINGRVEHKMDHLSCFSGGLYALSAQHAKDPEHYLTIGKELTHTCRESYMKTPIKLGPEAFRFSDSLEAEGSRPNDKPYLLRPETFESYFVLWRITKDPKYREWGWEAAQALETYCRADNGYSGIKDVYQTSPVQDDVQQSYFLAETLKYLFLLFSEDDVLSLDDWVLNTEAHPLPVQKGLAATTTETVANPSENEA